MSLILALAFSVCGVVLCGCFDLPPNTMVLVIAIILAGGLAGLSNGN